MDESELRKQAMENLRERRSFFGLLAGHVGVSVMMIVIWAVSGGGFFWPVFPILGMGLAAAGSWWKLFGQKPINDADIEAEMRRLRGDDV